MEATLPSPLRQLARTSSGYSGVLSLLGQDVKVVVDFEGCPEQATLDLAAQVVGDIARIDGRCRSLIADSSLDDYNNGWRMGEVAAPGVDARPFENSGLNKQEFCGRLLLSSVSVNGDKTTEVWYECGELFWGHSMFVTAFDGVVFEDAHAQMFG